MTARLVLTVSLVAILSVDGNTASAQTEAYSRLSDYLRESTSAFDVSPWEQVESPNFTLVQSIRRPLSDSMTMGEVEKQPPEIRLGYKGYPLSEQRLLVQLAPYADPKSIQALLERARVTIVGGVPEIGLLVVRVAPEAPSVPLIGKNAPFVNLRNDDTTRLLHAANLLHGDKYVVAVSPDTFLSASRIPVPANPACKGKNGLGNELEWSWDHNCANDGNHGVKAARFPQAWNLIGDSSEIKILPKVGVLDLGFFKHADLSFQIHGVNQGGGTGTGPNHGTHVLGTIGARFNNGSGIDGCLPAAHFIACPVPTALDPQGDIPATYRSISHVIASFFDLIRKHDDLKVVNISLAYNWHKFGINPNANETAQELVKSQGVYVRSLADYARERGVIIVSAAGNDCGGANFKDIDAQWASPFNWAAFNPGPEGQPPASNIIVVESLDRDGKRSWFSNVGGHLSAHGEDVLSTIAANDGYAAMQGTSMAAPHVTALVGLMYAYNPKLGINDVLSVLNLRRGNASETAAALDAFAVLTRCHDKQRVLLDLADFDHNGKVDEADADAFNAALKEVSDVAMGGTFKNDLNRDGVVDKNEAHFSRFDLNGSGTLSDAPADKRELFGKSLSDREVLQEAMGAK